MTKNVEIPDNLNNLLEQKFSSGKNFSLNNTIYGILNARLNTVYICEGQYKYLIKEEQLQTIGKNQDLIKLSKTEKKIIHLLATINSEYIKTEEVLNEVWKDENTTGTIESLRNFIKKIRAKTTKDFIVNHFNQGYSLNIYKGYVL